MRYDAAPGLDLSALNALGCVRLFRELPLRFLPHRSLAPPVLVPERLVLSAAGRLHREEALETETAGCGDGLAFTARSACPLGFEMQSDGTLHAFAFWFSQALHEASGLVLDTGPEEEAGGVGRHWRQAAVALNPPLQVKRGERVNIELTWGMGVNGGIEIQMGDRNSLPAQ